RAVGAGEGMSCCRHGDHLVVVPAEAALDLADADALLPPGDDLPRRCELAVVEEQIAALGAGGWPDDALAQVEVEVRAAEAGGGAEVAAHIEAGEGGIGRAVGTGRRAADQPV